MARLRPDDEFNNHDRRQESPTAIAVAKQERTQEDRDLSHQMLGAAKYAEHLHKQTGSDLMRFLLTVREQKRFIDYDCSGFDEFLDSAYSPISSSTFYRKFELFKKEGPSYDLLEEMKVPARVRQQLTAGDYTLNDLGLMIGDKQIEAGENPTIIRQMFEKLVKGKIAAEAKLAPLEAIKEKYDKLKAQIDEDNEKPLYVTAYLEWVEATLTFINEVDDLPGEMKATRAIGDLDHVSELLDQLYRAYGESFPYQRKKMAPGKLKAVGGSQ